MESPKFSGAFIAAGPTDWQIIQRGPDGTGKLTVSGRYWSEIPGAVEVKLARESDGAPVRQQLDWQVATQCRDNVWEHTLTGIPAGGLYRLETRIKALSGDPWRLTGEKIHFLAVGDIWVIAGQSNAVGYGHGPVDDGPEPGVHLFGMNNRWRLASHPLFDPTDTKHAANRDGGWTEHSPWLSFAKKIHRTTGIPIGLIPCALGGSSLAMWNTDEDGFLYRNMMEHIAAAGNHVAGMLWYQGCSDASVEGASTYEERFGKFIRRWRADLGSEYLPVITVQLNRICGQAEDRPADTGWGLLREAQRVIPSRLPLTAVVPTTDLPLSDLIHLSASANIILGARTARAALRIKYGESSSFDAAQPERALLSPDGTKIILTFRDVNDFLAPIHFPWPATTPSCPVGDFTVEDETGEVPQATTDFPRPDQIVIGLKRPAVGKTVIHANWTRDPQPSLRDGLQIPIFSFHGFAVER